MNRRFSGKFIVRLQPTLHRQLVETANEEGLSLNRLCALRLSERSKGSVTTQPAVTHRPLITRLQRKFGEDFLGLLIFGSQVTGEMTTGSDIDLLIVLGPNLPLERSLYRWWDEELPPTEAALSPQFVHLPGSTHDAGGLWCEVAMAHHLLWEKGRAVSHFLEELKNRIAEGVVRRSWSNGQPYWIWRSDEEQISRA